MHVELWPSTQQVAPTPTPVPTHSCRLPSCWPVLHTMGCMAEPQALTEPQVALKDQPHFVELRPRAGYKPHQKWRGWLSRMVGVAVRHAGGGRAAYSRSAGQRQWRLALPASSFPQAEPESPSLPEPPKRTVQLGGSQRAGMGDFPGEGGKAPGNWLGAEEGAWQPSAMQLLGGIGRGAGRSLPRWLRTPPPASLPPTSPPLRLLLS